MIWRAFRRSPSPSANETAWWRDANAAVEAVSPAAIRALRDATARASLTGDDAERQEEMLDGLDQLLSLTAAGLPVIETQHRVIGTDTCHFVAPARLAAEVDTPSKVFVTSRRLIFSSARVRAWPWHRLRSLVRVDRALVVAVVGPSEEVQINCNSYGDAIVAHHLVKGLGRDEK